jgi:hypothetical protein
MHNGFDTGDLEREIRALVDEVVDEIGVPGRPVGEGGRWVGSERRRENLKAVAVAAVLQGIAPGIPIRRQSQLWKAAEINRAHGEGFLAEDSTIVEQLNVRLTLLLMRRGLLPRRGHLYSGLAHAPRARGAAIPGFARVRNRVTGKPIDGWMKVNMFIGGIDWSQSPDSRTFAHRLRGKPLLRRDDRRRLSGRGRRWLKLFHDNPETGYAHQAIGLAADVQGDLRAAGVDPTQHAVVLCEGRLEDADGDVGLMRRDQELPGDSLGFLVRQTRDRLAPGTLTIAACSSTVDGPGSYGSRPLADWALRAPHGAASFPAAVGLPLLTKGHQAAATPTVVSVASGDCWDVCFFKGDVLVDGRATGWSLLLFRVFEEDDEGVDGTNVAASGPLPQMDGEIATIVEALLPLHVPGPESARFALCRANSFNFPLALMACNGHSADAQERMEALRDLVNIGRLVRVFGDEAERRLLAAA